MKFTLIILSFTLFAKLSFSQGFTQSADGKSTLLFKGTGIGLDITKADLSFGINNLTRKVYSDTSVRLIYGLTVRTRNEQGLSGIFTEGEFVPSASGQFYAGFTFSNINAINRSYVSGMRTEFERGYETAKTIKRSEFIEAVDTLIYDEGRKIENVATRNRFIEKMTALVSRNAARPVFLFYSEVKNEPDDTEQERAVKKTLKDSTYKWYQEFRKWDQQMRVKVSEFKEDFDKLNRFRVTLFGFGEKNGLAFKRFVRYDSSNLSGSFENRFATGGRLGGGLNVQWRNFWFGLTYSYVDGNNFDELVQREFTWTRETTSRGQTITEESKIVAYRGIFREVEYNELNADLVYNIRFGDSLKYNLLLNPYIRANFFSRDTTVQIRSVTNAGLGLYFFQNRTRFMGGFYLELPDVKNRVEMLRTVEDRNFKPPLKRFSVGIVTRFNINSLFTWL